LSRAIVTFRCGDYDRVGSIKTYVRNLCGACAMSPTISKVFIANRGEIALRILRACDRLGVSAVCAVSEVDLHSLVARTAAEIALLGPAPARESYLNIERIVGAAIEHGCDALHPGYGFLSENAAFAQAVVDAGITFIGPDPKMIEFLGDKVAARARVEQFGVPFTKGSPGSLSNEELLALAQSIGFPLIIKAAAGGGGRGMRVVRSYEQMVEELPHARSEAVKFFGSDNVYFEQFIEKPRHVEVQIMGDSHGNILHFGTRDCSAQRRNQKVIEEAPAPFLSDELRDKIHIAAVNVARSVDYRNAGTVEFMVKDDALYFLEMNTRIQVEHPVTEMVTGVDLVEMQIRVARGEPIGLKQADVVTSGHAIELRLYAEDPESDFAPSTGVLEQVVFPGSRPQEFRIEAGYEEGDKISRHYDAMIAKLIVKGADRYQALDRAREAISQTTITGVRTNCDFLGWLLRDTPFRARPLDIQWIGRENRRDDVARYRASRMVKDPAHRIVGTIGEYQERFIVPDPHGVELEVMITHKRDGTFVAELLGPCGESYSGRSPRTMRRWSNDREAAIASLCQEVINEPK
jgi:acetyl/propionyl-CoA carboxylase alpha subunit